MLEMSRALICTAVEVGFFSDGFSLQSQNSEERIVQLSPIPR